MIMYPIDQKDNIYCNISQCNVVNIFLNQCYENGETYLQIIEQQILFRCKFLKQTKDQEKNKKIIHATSFKPNKWFTKNIIIHVSKIIMLCYSFTFKLLKWHLQLKTHLQIRFIFVYFSHMKILQHST